VGQHPELTAVPQQGWLEVVSVGGLEGLGAFAAYARLLGSGARNVGEAETLAWAETNEAIAVVDEAAGRTAGGERGVEVHGTLWLIFEAYNAALLDRKPIEELVQRLADTDARFPCSPAEVFEWAPANDLLRR
jgi:predicted nucleic acid-binding protein